MKVLNRSALLVRPKRPFVDWLRKLPDPPDETPEALDSDGNVYLLPEYETIEGAEQYLKECFEDVFYYELFNWWTDESVYPDISSWSTFCDWFGVEHRSMLVDLWDYEVTSEELGEA